MENHLKVRNAQRKRRKARVRKKLRGSAEKPRLSIFRSNKHILAQLIDDEAKVTLFGVGTMSKQLSAEKKSKDAAGTIGKLIAEHAKKNNIERVVFDRGQYKYHGLIGHLADAAREGGLQF